MSGRRCLPARSRPSPAVALLVERWAPCYGSAMGQLVPIVTRLNVAFTNPSCSYTIDQFIKLFCDGPTFPDYEQQLLYVLFISDPQWWWFYCLLVIISDQGRSLLWSITNHRALIPTTIPPQQPIIQLYFTERLTSSSVNQSAPSVRCYIINASRDGLEIDLESNPFVIDPSHFYISTRYTLESILDDEKGNYLFPIRRLTFNNENKHRFDGLLLINRFFLII